MTPPEWAEVISAVAGTASVAVQVFLLWTGRHGDSSRKHETPAGRPGAVVAVRSRPSSARREGVWTTVWRGGSPVFSVWVRSRYRPDPG